MVAGAARAVENDKVVTFYDKTVDDARVGVFEGQLECRPGHAGPSFPTSTVLTLDKYWILVSDPEFSALGLQGKVIYRDKETGDFCQKHRDAFAGHETFIGVARRVVTDHHGIRFGVCWHWLEEKITLDVNHYRFESWDSFPIGTAKAEMCAG